MRRLVQEQGSPQKRIQLVVPKEASKKIFRITGLDRIFPIYDTLEVAKENFETAEPGIVTGSAK
jgi:anti-anti-sigma regulatory factor